MLRLAEYNRTTRLLADYHHVVFRSFAQDGLIHSDIHLGCTYVMCCGECMDVWGKSGRVPCLGNACLNGAQNGLVLFDIGQFERITLPETTALLWYVSERERERERERREEKRRESGLWRRSAQSHGGNK